MGQRVMHTLIVDDEPIARRILREELEKVPALVIAGEAENGKQALQQIATLRPDLVLLDLQMPVMGGFEVVRRMGGEHLPVVIIVTAFDQHAMEAFDAGAVDYLLKPVGERQLRRAIERARKLCEDPREVAGEVAKITPVEARKIVGRTGEEYVLLDPEEILAFQAEGELVWMVTAKQRFLATQSLQAIENHLKYQQFRRVHRNAIVNVNHVRTISALSSQRWLVTLSNSLQLVASKRQAHNIRSVLQW